MWHRKAMDKEIVKAMATKFSEIFAISMLKKHRKFCRRGLTHLDATPTFKNRPNTYETPCNINEGLGLLKLAETVLILINPSQSNVKDKTMLSKTDILAIMVLMFFCQCFIFRLFIEKLKFNFIADSKSQACQS